MFFKIALTALAPIGIIFLFISLWSALCICFKKFWWTLKRNIIVSFIVIMFLLHPTLTSIGFNLFKCYDFDFDVKRLYIDMSLKCWGKEHLIFTLAVGVPILLVWVLGVPLSGFLLLCWYWKHLSDKSFMSKYIVLYQGLRDSAFYWEFVNTFRKITLITLNIAIPSSSSYYKALLAVIFLFLLLRLQLKIKPYQKKMVNSLEGKEIITSMITLYGASIFL